MADPETQARRICSFLNWPPRADLADQIARRFDPSLPTQASSGQNQTHLHPATLRLEEQLTRLEASPLEEQNLLASALAAGVQQTNDPLNLNGLHPERQNLLPKLRVTIVTAELQGWGPSGGIGSAYRELAEALRAAGHPVRVLLVCGGDPPAEVPASGLQVERLDPSGLTRLELCRRVGEQLRGDPGDVIHLHDWLGLGSGLRAALGADAPPLIVGLHGPSAWARSGNPWPEGVAPEPLYEEGLVRALEQDTLAQADLLVAPSRFMANWVEQHLPVQQPVLVQRNCPLSRGRITAGPETQASRLVYFGRLEQRKGLLLFLEALEQLPETPAEVVFVGDDCRIAEERWGSELVQERLDRLGVRFRLETGLERDQALQRLRELAGVVVIPSLIENSPCVVEELLNSGLRLVTTGVGGTPELVSTASQPWLSAPEPAALASHLAKALQPVEPGAYQLEARVPAWQITLSWQAFHERLPRRQPKPTEAPGSEQAPTNPVRRSLRLAKRVARKLMNLARNR
jgi:glycosyltransferase involved in cell wall biosynthesis